MTGMEARPADRLILPRVAPVITEPRVASGVRSKKGLSASRLVRLIRMSDDDGQPMSRLIVDPQ
jgi:hypothetical protein